MSEKEGKMKKYIGTKMLEAKQMTRGEYNKYRGWTIPENENPDDEGYLVKYSDGYRLCTNMTTLPETAIMMNSADYKDRFKAEYLQLVIRYRGLKAMLENWDKGELSFSPTCPRSTYNMQIASMTDYLAVLEARAVMENVDLNIKFSEGEKYGFL